MATYQSLIINHKKNQSFFEIENPVTIYLIRHGETDFNAEHKLRGWIDLPLNTRGRKQAKETAKNFKNLKIDKIYCSDLLRSQQTAEEISKATGVEAILNPTLRPINFGNLNGQPIAQIQEQMDELQKLWITNPEMSSENGESWREFQDRNYLAFLQILQESKENERIVITAHLRNCIYFLALVANGLKPLHGEAILSVNHFFQETACVSVVKYNKETEDIIIVQENTQYVSPNIV